VSCALFPLRVLLTVESAINCD